MIKKITIIITTLTLLCACSTTAKKISTTAKKISIPVGKMKQVELLDNFQSFSSGYKNYVLSAEQVNMVKSWPASINIDIYFGTWCPDSQREVPHLLKALEFNANVSKTLIALDGHKSDPLGLAKSAAVQYTPTFVVFVNNQEVGRVVERPKKDLISDINAMLAIIK